MRDKNLFHLLLGLNVALALAFVVYLVLSSNHHPTVSTTAFPVPEKVEPREPAKTITPEKALATNTEPVQPIVSTPSPALAAVPTNHILSVSNPVPPKPVPAGRTYGWRDVDTDAYQAYLSNLRTVGCPEDKIRSIILADINELIAQKRLKEAVVHDPQWWRSEPELTIAGVLRDKGIALDEERRQLVARWLGEEEAGKQKSQITYWNSVQLTGPVLGALSQDDHQTVQEVCAESMDRYQSIFWSTINSGQPLNQVELAKLRQRTRTELTKVLKPEALEEFLLRYSHNANRLRQDLRGFNPTPEEFRKIFRATDSIDHALQLEYGGLETLSPQQRERYETRRDQAIKEVLTPARYEAYLLTKDPLYRQAQMMALQYGAPSSAIMPIYNMTRENESRRKEILQDATLTPEQKRQAINNVYLQQQQTVRKIVAEAGQQPSQSQP
jgi:hypothetical protein